MKIFGAVLDEIGASRPYTSSAPLAVRELDLAPPGERELLVRIDVAGLCHSDLSVVNGSRVRPTPMLLGHEAAGTVVEVGSEVIDIRPDQKVVMTFLPRCANCRACASEGRIPCENGSESNGKGTLLDGAVRLSRGGEPVLHHLGVSGFATHAVVDRRSVVVVDDDVPAEVAALMGCAVLTGGGAVLNAGHPRPGDHVVVVGLGGVGMAAVLTALSEDGVQVSAVDTMGSKREQALALGAHAAHAPEEAIGIGLRGNIVIEAAGNPRAFETAVALTGLGGTTVTVGLPDPSAVATISPLGLVAEGRTITGSYLGSAVPSREIPQFIQRWRDGRLPVERLVSSRIPLSEINLALETLAAGEAVRQLITFEDYR
ncbi:alcohol dehydrogenase catalytic domain-containing protein [Rhodococcus koreensis]|uniref:alcohol dehydrogenase catalytic domain-containing protein n=1 Tax=Rhodococcus koreensis TaxID=99653 RepID=UPI00366C7CA6